MSLLRILRYPEASLKDPAKEVANIDGKLANFIDSMTQTMYAAPGVGLAAPQVGAAQRVIVLDTDHENRGKHLLKLINPEIVEAEGSIIWEEGCLSIVDFTADVKRAAKVLVRAWTPEQKQIDIEAEDLLAVALQHEIDHLEGKLFIDRISRLKREMYRRKVKKMIKDGTFEKGEAALGPDLNPSHPLKIVFMGTPELAAHILERLLAGSGEKFQVVCVVTRPDQPRGRGQKPQPSEVAAIAENYRLATLKPTKIRTPEFLAQLKAFEPDLLVVAAYGRILPNDVLAAPRIMPINVHASLLPRHRGASPIEGAILAGDQETGVTIMRVVEQMDAGPMLHWRTIPIAGDETTASLKQKLAELGADALLETLVKFRSGDIVETPQDESHATYTKIISKPDATIDWSKPAPEIERMTRAYDPWPVARTTFGGSDLMIYRARVVATDEGEPGSIASIMGNPIVRCSMGALELREVQAPGRKRMRAGDWARGRRLAVGDRLGI